MVFPKKILSLGTALLISTSACASSHNNTPPAEYTQWLNQLKKEMIERGISQKTIDKVYAKDYYKPNSPIIKIDRKQAEFLLTSTDYLNRVVNKKRVETARKKYKGHASELKKIADKYGVQPHYIIAFWAVETNFGQNFGGYNIIEALTTLSYDTRRPKFFKEELYQALKIIDTQNIEYTKMQSSWAGAMGHFQFMPSTYNAYAVDYNGDNVIDIWESFGDAAASAANYLSKIGWNKENEWGQEVDLPWNFDFSEIGRENKKTVKEWKKIGVKISNANIPDTVQAAIIAPEGKKGRAYLVLNNFNKIMVWNRSENYALAIGTLADYIRTDKTWKPFQAEYARRLTTDDIKEVQSFINKIEIAHVDEDGKLGPKTKKAIQKLQKKARLVPDGYPDAVLLNKIENYNPDRGFTIPVPPKKITQRN